MPPFHHFKRVDFTRFKAFKTFRLNLKHFNIMVGPNNAGKSTVLAAFRILAAAYRKATARRSEVVRGPNGTVSGYKIDLSTISVAEENIFYNYNDDEKAEVVFSLSNGNSLTLYFPEPGVCFLLPDAQGRSFSEPSTFRRQFNCPIGFVPILGPVEHNEPLFEKDAARLALFNYRAARNFRNIWHHYPDRFDEFREALKRTWPGMDIQKPEIDRSHERPRLHMYCPEDRIPRELCWSGFGFQVWCQMLTHIIQSQDSSIFLIDEPDIYLHAELQRQLIDILRNLGPDILLATHSTEIITEAEADDIVLINKQRSSARRLNNPTDIEQVFQALGSNINPILTQLAKTRRALFVEGKDFQIITRFAQKLNIRTVANRRDFAVIPVEGFNPERIRNLKQGIETTLGGKILAGSIFDRDYRSLDECRNIMADCEAFCQFSVVHLRKEIENFLLVPEAMDRALRQRLDDRVRRGGLSVAFEPIAQQALDSFASSKKAYVASQFASEARRFSRASSPQIHETSIMERALAEVEDAWLTFEGRTSIIPGKDAIADFNRVAQDTYRVSVTPTAIVEAMLAGDVPEDMRKLIQAIDSFAGSRVT